MPDRSPEPNLTGKRILAVDGVKGFAILAILLYHFAQQFSIPSSDPDQVFYWLCSTGWVAVELFFVLSGFLITSVLLDARRTGGYFTTFLARRSLRILPLYYGLLFAAFVLLPWVVGTLPDRFQLLQEKQWWFWTLLANWLFVREGSFGQVPGGYLWWIAMEQQFLVFWPILVLWLPRGKLAIASVALFLTSWGLRLALLSLGATPVAVYCNTFTHMEGLAVGTLLAVGMRTIPLKEWPMRKLKMTASALALILVAMFVWNGKLVFWHTPVAAVGASFLAVCFGYLLVVCLRLPRQSLRYRFLANSVLCSFGRYSYALYLLHPPVGVAVARVIFDPTRHPVGNSIIPALIVFFLLATAACWLLAWASWHLYEKHFLRLRPHYPRTPVDSPT